MWSLTRCMIHPHSIIQSATVLRRNFVIEHIHLSSIQRPKYSDVRRSLVASVYSSLTWRDLSTGRQWHDIVVLPWWRSWQMCCSFEWDSESTYISALSSGKGAIDMARCSNTPEPITESRPTENYGRLSPYHWTYYTCVMKSTMWLLTPLHVPLSQYVSFGVPSYLHHRLLSELSVEILWFNVRVRVRRTILHLSDRIVDR